MSKLYLDWLWVFYLWARRYWSAILRVPELPYRWFTKLPSVESLEDIEKVSSEVKWVADWTLAPHVKLRRFWWDCLSYPQTVWARKKDDCDGFAILNCELGTQIGIKMYILSVVMEPRELSHAVAYGKQGATPFMFTNGRLVMFEDDRTLEDVVQTVAAPAKRILAWSLEDHKTGELVRLHRGLRGQVPTILRRRKQQ